MNISNQKGTALVETAIVLVLLLLIVFGIAEIGRAMYITNALYNAAREGARRAAVSASPLDTAALETKIKSCIPFDQTGLDIDITPAAPVANDTVSVEVALPFKCVTPLIAEFDGIILKGRASMRYE